jgi:hypothetical protein
VKATVDGVVRYPSAFSITLGVPPSMIDTQELVVPRSIPITYSPYFTLIEWVEARLRLLATGVMNLDNISFDLLKKI